MSGPIPCPGIRFVKDRRNVRCGDGEIVRDEGSTQGTWYRGRAATVVQAGLVEHHMLPEQPGRAKTAVRLPPSSLQYSSGVTIFKQSGDMFRVFIPHNKAEIARRKRIEQAARHQQQADEFKCAAIKGLIFCLGMARTYLVEDRFGFDHETICEFEQIAEDLEGLLRDGNVQISPEALEKEGIDFGLPKCNDDESLQTFLTSMLHNQSLVKNERPGDL